jgi:glycosyltransferase involved in cell wall biosynthesis
LRILFVGMLSESKGLLDLVEACGRLSACGVPCRLEIMGAPESDEFIARLRARIVDLNLAHHVHFLGVLTGPEKFAAYAGSDVFCMPTFYERETFGIVFVEAMACGLPVVATRWRGVPSVVDDGETGFLVEPHDFNAVADRLAHLATSPQLREQMGVAGRNKFLREFTLPRHIERMRRVFLEVAGHVSDVEEAESRDEVLAMSTSDD